MNASSSASKGNYDGSATDDPDDLGWSTATRAG